MPHLTFLISAPGGSEWIMILLVAAFYFLPTIIAGNRKKSNTGAIFVLNLFLGWSVIGWVVSLVWALSADKQQTPTTRPQAQPEVVSTKTITHQDKIDQLRQLKQLLDEGILTNDEFNMQKGAILSF